MNTCDCGCDCECQNEALRAIPEVYGSSVFNDALMRERLPKNVYKSLKRTIDEGSELDPSIADIVANAMKDWAIEKGATHFCHWFQPMTGITAEKHDSFISPTSDGRIFMEFSGKELRQGEPDASSFPSGGLRATFEVRGYTPWDCTSPVFIKSDGANTTLFIPSFFCSYHGEALDKKTPLLRSMEALNKQALRVLKVLGNTKSSRVIATLGSEQEYFLIEEELFKERLDLQLAGRTLFGAPSPKGQELEDQYFGSLHERIATFMNDLNSQLWQLGVAAKTQHNEVAPAQYEIAPVFGLVNVATDHNQLTMETLQKVARRHGLACLLHEKPFAGVNGSGKHNNWAMCTDDGINLLNPGDNPHDNIQFIVFLFAVIRAVDKYAKLLRATVASPGNDHRLGANEAPPAIVSIFLGDQLADIVTQIENGGVSKSKKGGVLKLGVNTLPPLPKDSTDRNRTSPFAFTGNKFEFRMVGSSQSPSGANFVLNTIVAETLREIADALEGASGKELNAKIQKLLQGYAKQHKRVIFNGDNYSKEWHQEAAKRGLPNIKNCVDSLLSITEKDAEDVLAKHKVLSKKELHARQEILLEAYAKNINIEGRCALQMARRQILPAAVRFVSELSDAVASAELVNVSAATQRRLLADATRLMDAIDKGITGLDKALAKASAKNDAHGKAEAYRDIVIPAMGTLRMAADELETIIPDALWPLPTYAEMLFTK